MIASTKTKIYNSSSSENIHLLLFGHIRIHWHICLELFFSCKQCIFLSRFRWIIDIVFGSNGLQLKHYVFVSYKNTDFRFTRHWLMDWSCVDYCDVFISCLDSFWRHPFTPEDPLVSKWCNATFLQICSDDETNAAASWMAWGEVLHWSDMKIRFQHAGLNINAFT